MKMYEEHASVHLSLLILGPNLVQGEVILH